VARPAEVLEIHLQDRHATTGHPLAQHRCPPGVQLDGEHPAPRPDERERQSAFTGSEIDDHVAGTDR
jgi:hypothetical protein